MRTTRTKEEMQQIKKFNERSHILKIAIRAIFLIFLSLVCVVGKYSNCKDFNSSVETYGSKFLTNFTQSVYSSNISVILRIPLCSCLYKNGYYMTLYTVSYWLCLLSIYCYLSFEFIITYLQIISYYFKIVKKKFPAIFCTLFFLIIFLIIGILIFLFVYLFCISLLFELFNNYILNGNSFKSPSFITNDISLDMG